MVRVWVAEFWVFGRPCLVSTTFTVNVKLPG